MDWEEICDLIEENSGLNKPLPDLLMHFNRVEACSARTWVGIVDGSIVGYSESHFVDGILRMILNGNDISEILPHLSHQRQIGVSAIRRRYLDLLD